LRIFCCIFRLKFRWRIWVSASSRSCDIVIVILLCVADHSTRGFWFFSCLQLRIWNLGIDQYGCCMSFGNNSSQEWFRSLDNYNISSEYISPLVVPANHELCCRSKEIDGPRANIGGGF
jgi:hypothetical protein